MSVVVRNIDLVSNTYAGQTIASGDSYIVQPSERHKWASSDTLLADIASGKAQINDGSADVSGVANQIAYLLGQDIGPSDTDGAKISRPKAAKAGWTYHLTAPEFTTSKIDSLYHEDVAGNALTEASIKYYDDEDNELTTQGACDTDCIKTVFTFEPSWDYEIIGGTLKTVSTVAENVRVWVIAVPDVPAIYGGSKVMVQSVNLKFIDQNNGIVADGRASKYMAYSATYHTNKLQVTIKHPIGHQEAIMMAFEVFKA